VGRDCARAQKTPTKTKNCALSAPTLLRQASLRHATPTLCDNDINGRAASLLRNGAGASNCYKYQENPTAQFVHYEGKLIKNVLYLRKNTAIGKTFSGQRSQ